MEIYDGAERLTFGPPRIRVLLAVLLTAPGQLMSMDKFIDDLWPEAPPPDSRALIHGYISRLRRVLGSGSSGQAAARRLVTRKPGYLLDVGEQELDLHRYQRIVASARTVAPRDRIALLRQADQLWHGTPFADVPPTPAITAAVTRLAELRLATLEKQFDAMLEADQDEGLVAELTDLVARHPLRERFVSQLMLALHRSGRTADALTVFQQTVERLRDELGVDPGLALRTAHQTVIAEQASPPIPTRVPCQLPSSLPLLVGRDDTLAAGEQVLASATPWLAVTGPGGVGKTTFALCLADRARAAFPDGILVARRGSEPVDESMLTRFLGAFGIPISGQLRKSPRDRGELFWELLGARRVLIVLDDVPDESYVRPLLPVASGCGLVVTSRRRLAGLESLRSLPLDVLPVDVGISLMRTTAGTQDIDRHAGAIVELCGGLPLAIKIAGARLRTRPNWTADDLVHRLTDTRSRLDWLQLGDIGVRTSLAESMSELTADQHRLLCRLGLLDFGEFAGWVTAALLGQDRWGAERVLDDLVEAHLVEPTGHGVTGPRYRIHDLVRLVARELADEVDVEAITRLRHGWLALAATADNQLAHWFGLDPEPTPVWLPPQDTVAAVAADPMRWFDEEHDALMTVVHCDADAVTWALAQRMSSHLELRGRYDDWGRVLRAGLAAADNAHDRQGQATMLGLMMQAEAARDENDSALRYAALAFAAYQAVQTPAPPLAQAPAVCTPALEDARRRGDALAVGLEACRLAEEKRLEGAQIDYLALFEEARDAFRAGDIPLLELWMLKNPGLVYLRQHRFTEAEGCLRRGQALHQNEANLFNSGGDLAGVAATCGRADLAEQLATAAIDVANRTHDPWTAARALHTLADIRASRGDFDASARTYQKALNAWTDLRNPRRVAMIEEAMARLGCTKISIVRQPDSVSRPSATRLIDLR
ncbi:BTAD domain-containing putative transcriptional regulator [Phytohabitans sp. LJ34]|uniref:AfsR/SARP family transcriptional regulator n=1 Tax=Phytohabitans sp. LJ34 TaxID=3452217 RepID=UPI003F8B86DF